MKFKVGDMVMFIRRGEFYGMQGTVVKLYNVLYEVEYTCELTRKMFNTPSYSEVERSSDIRKLTKLERVLR